MRWPRSSLLLVIFVMRPESHASDHTLKPAPERLRWARSRAGHPVVKRRTAKDRFSRALRRVKDWCRLNRHDPLRVQQQGLARKLRGHYAYFGVTANNDAIARFFYEVKQAWWKWLSRRSRSRPFPWPRMAALLERLPLPEPRIVHRYGT